jgi:hypothetical protein
MDSATFYCNVSPLPLFQNIYCRCTNKVQQGAWQIKNVINLTLCTYVLMPRYLIFQYVLARVCRLCYIFSLVFTLTSFLGEILKGSIPDCFGAAKNQIGDEIATVPGGLGMLSNQIFNSKNEIICI